MEAVKCTSCDRRVWREELRDDHCELCWALVPQVEPFYSTGDTLTEVTGVAEDAANRWLLRAGLRVTDVLSTRVALAACVVNEMPRYGYVITLTVQRPRWKVQVAP